MKVTFAFVVLLLLHSAVQILPAPKKLAGLSSLTSWQSIALAAGDEESDDEEPSSDEQ